MHAEVLPWTICLPTLVLITQAVLLSELDKQTNRQTDKQTDATERPTPAAIQPTWVCDRITQMNVGGYCRIVTQISLMFTVFTPMCGRGRDRSK